MLQDRLGYLLKHAQSALAAHTAAALEPLNINGRELAVLSVLGAAEPLAQQQAATRLSVDRTTMVDLVDTLERKGMVERRSDPADRRRNLVHLTPEGEKTLAEGNRRYQEIERGLLTESEADDLKRLLRRLLANAES
ncbi:MarR family transcriptional regulator [Actinoplanes sp. KI2]|uniref:MarR family winged helix-turn-helix transcriptional regulator n=1 Tax=Actinoplanes sp. KI2 TaxID=2983315 RepID=UPI0021D57753|nr:MarR family transcriptional regulator [Actinoplanes sp. KI2]MCU7726685.1 MarR family transcriptional regulator [Actinoplanes sp. KI2]